MNEIVQLVFETRARNKCFFDNLNDKIRILDWSLLEHLNLGYFVVLIGFCSCGCAIILRDCYSNECVNHGGFCHAIA